MITFLQIENIICDIFNIDDIKIKSRKSNIVDARRAFGYICCETLMPFYTYDTIGLQLKTTGYTISYYYRSAKTLSQTDKMFLEKLTLCITQIKLLQNKIE